MAQLLLAADKRSGITRSGQKSQASGQREGIFGYRKRFALRKRFGEPFSAK